MKFNLFCVIVLFSLLTNNNFSQTTTYFIKFKDSYSRIQIDEYIANKKFHTALNNSRTTNNITAGYFAKEIAKNIESLNKIIKITFPFELSDEELNSLKNSNSEIDYIQRGNVYKIDFDDNPSDTLFTQQWSLAKIKAVDAWKISKGSPNILIAIIDTGIDYQHPDLKNKIYLNNGEIGFDEFGNDKRFNGIDDDGNGFIDDYMGWDFTDRVGFPFDSTGGDYRGWDNDPMDENIYSHGTAVAGIIGAETNNIEGIAGIAPNIFVLNLRAFDPDGFGEEDDVAAAILYAVQQGAKVINMSFGDDSFSFVLRDVIRYAYSQDVILVASSGNRGLTTPHYPSGYSEVICVGNSTEQDFVISSSNYGSTLDLVAPGTQILTTLRQVKGSYGLFSGTSAAAPHVSAAAGLILSLRDFSNEEVKQIIKTTADDILTPGWDLRSGAGRLNLEKALRVLSTAKVLFHNPRQDFATFLDSIEISASVLSPYFEKFELYYGVGENPNSWVSLLSNQRNQISSQTIYTLNVSSLSDSVYTLRLVVYQTNGVTMEERVNFHVMRKLPSGELINIFPAYYGNKPTIISSFYTNTPSVVYIYFRKKGTSNFDFVSLDGFSSNNQFIKKLHYGFIPTNFMNYNTTYEIYFEIENLVGRRVIVKDGTNYFEIKTNDIFFLREKRLLSYELPPGIIYSNSITINGEKFIVNRDNDTYLFSTFYRLVNGNLEKSDSLKERIIKSDLDFNNNGRRDLVTFWGRNIYLLEQKLNSFSFDEKGKRENNNSWPAFTGDIFSNGVQRLGFIANDSLLLISRINNDFTLTVEDTLKNFTQKGFGGGKFDTPNAILLDFDGDGKKEIWMVDNDGDIFSYKAIQPGNYQEFIEINTGFLSSSSYLAHGDFNGDGKADLAVLLHSYDRIDIASFLRLVIFTYDNGQLKFLYDQGFLDPSVEFNSSFRKANNSLRFVDIDNDGSDELVLFVFPYAYIIKNNSDNPQIISYDENINSNSILAADLNNNGAIEIAFPYNDKIAFYEFGNPTKPETPYLLTGASLDSIRINLLWVSNLDTFYIYKGLNPTELFLIDSVTTKEFIDSDVILGHNYYYAVQAKSFLFSNIVSNLSTPIKIYHHKPGELKSVSLNRDNKSITVQFTEKILNTIESLQSFLIKNNLNGEVQNISSIAPLNQYSYLITFRNRLLEGTYNFKIVSLKDYYGSQVKTDSILFNVVNMPVQKEFFIESFQIVNPYLIRITFNETPDSSSVVNKLNYYFEPSNNITSISISNNEANTIYLDLTGNKPVGAIGKEYRLELKNIFSSIESGSIPILKGAGATIVLTGNKNDLSEVYVYPNPVNIEKHNQVMFANLPANAEIIIWNVNGKKIISFKENDGNGGAEWNLKDFDNKLIPSGVYIYRISRLDNQNNEVETKIGKFSVVR